MTLLAVGAGGIAGAVLRYSIAYLLDTHEVIAPLKTLLVNVIGSFLLGYLQGLASVHKLPRWLVLGFGTGLIGSFTTFSTLSLELVQYALIDELLRALIYLLSSFWLGLLFVYAGYQAGKFKKV
ncbi:fluoride efflux transporter CrcB [Bacillus lacus]|uniref:Fluoride-specific ion channel FluC n=1 Tax=Metabacillus lacus TaxID=1983721 RepID=A0A7X2LZ86_9BACI|nr:CrcB family protein [Metabacillus lacus]MRX71419.1 fluoride efflux transporter CrcB [Metabacillus lacus]